MLGRILGGCFALLLLHVSVLAPRAVAANPDPAHSAISGPIFLESSINGYPDGTGPFLVTIHDANDVPIQNATVYVYFTNCGQTKPSSYQPGAGGITCPDLVTGTTDENGTAGFDIMGAKIHRAASQPNSCADIYADGGSGQVLIGHTYVRAFDEDGANGLTGADMRYIACETAVNASTSDYDGNGLVNVIDLGIWSTRYFSQFYVNTAPQFESPPRCDNALTATATAVSGSLFLSAANSPQGTCASAANPQTITPACGSFTQTRIIASFTSSVAIPAPIGFEAELDLVGPSGDPLTDFWNFTPYPGCNGGSLSPRPFLKATGAGSFGGGCPGALVLNGSWQTLVGAVMYYPYPGTNAIDRALIRVVGTAYAGQSVGTASIGGNTTRYALFGLDLDPSNTTNCSGCGTAMALKLNSITINQPVGGVWACNAPAAPSTPPTFSPRSAEATAVATGDVRIFSATKDSSSAIFLNGVPPGYWTADVQPAAGSVRNSLAPPRPNPSRGHFDLRYFLARAGDVSMSITDVVGRRIRWIQRGTQTSGDHSAAWDGRTDDGSRAPAGLYYVRLQTPSGSLSRSLALIR